MKKIEATIDPSELDDVWKSLVELGIDGMSVCEVRAYDPRARSTWYRGCENTAWFAPLIRTEVVVAEDQVAACVGAIRRCADSDRTVIVVLPVEDAIRIRTGQHPARAA